MPRLLFVVIWKLLYLRNKFLFVTWGVTGFNTSEEYVLLPNSSQNVPKRIWKKKCFSGLSTGINAGKFDIQYILDMPFIDNMHDIYKKICRWTKCENTQRCWDLKRNK